MRFFAFAAVRAVGFRISLAVMFRIKLVTSQASVYPLRSALI